ncbi:MAG: hypothetical protein ACXVZ2_15265 [Gaiellaceae bacterium]
MGKRLSSPRFRRRVFWLSAVGLLAGAITVAVALLPSSKPKHEVFTKAPVKVYRSPRAVPLDNAGRAEVVFAASNFIKTAVRRVNVDASWEMTDPSLKQGFTRRQWAKGAIPVVPYPAAGIRQLSIDWSYRNDVALDIVLAPTLGSGLPPKSFMIELKRSGGPVHHRWLVASWAPQGVSEASMLAEAGKNQGPIPPATSLSSRWLLLPASLLLGALLMLPVFLAVRERMHGARAERAHRRSTQG